MLEKPFKIMENEIRKGEPYKGESYRRGYMHGVQEERRLCDDTYSEFVKVYRESIKKINEALDKVLSS